MSKATTSITPQLQTVNVERKCRKLALRIFVPSQGLPSQSLRHTNIELGGIGGYAKSAMYVRCTHACVANFCPSTVPSHKSCIDCRCDCRVHLRHCHASVRRNVLSEWATRAHVLFFTRPITRDSRQPSAARRRVAVSTHALEDRCASSANTTTRYETRLIH